MVLDSLHQDAAPDHPMEDASNQIADSRSHDQDPLDQMVDETKGASGDDCRDDKKGSVVIHTFQGMLKNEVECCYTSAPQCWSLWCVCSGAVSEMSSPLH